jgi:hypothetical protein
MLLRISAALYQIHIIKYTKRTGFLHLSPSGKGFRCISDLRQSTSSKGKLFHTAQWSLTHTQTSIIHHGRCMFKPYTQHKPHFMYLCRNLRWKSLLMVSLMNRFGVLVSPRAWFLNTTSSSHLQTKRQSKIRLTGSRLWISIT